MVRLRNDRWYTSAGQSRSRQLVRQQSLGSRRILSMCFLLALVILLMQKAADPTYVSQAFRSLGVPLDGSPPETKKNPSASPQTIAQHATADTEQSQVDPIWRSTVEDLVPRLLSSADSQDIEAFASTWFRMKSEMAPTDQQKRLDRLAAISTNELEAIANSLDSTGDWHAALAKFESTWKLCWKLLNEREQWRGPTDSGLPPSFSHAVSQYLDQRIVTSLRDATPWRKDENFAFERLLAIDSSNPNGSDPPAASTKLVSTQQLESESMSLKGTLIRFRGSVQRIDRIDRENLPSYWLLWLRGMDSSLQPVAVYTRDPVAEEIESQFPSRVDPLEVEVQALSAKRLAYAAQTGVEVAPTLFAQRLRPLSPPASVAEGQSSEALGLRFQLAIWIGLGFAALLLTPIWFYWRSPLSRRSKLRGKLSYRPPSKLVWLLCLAPSSGLINGAIAFGQVEPPWAHTQNPLDARLQLFQELLSPAFTPESLRELDSYLQGSPASSTSFPDVLLRAAQAAEKVGWESFQPGQSIEIEAEGISLSYSEASGTVRLASPARLSPTQASWFLPSDDEGFYRLGLIPSGESKVTWVFSRRVPKLWLSSATLNQPVKLRGLRFQNSESGDECLLASDLIWTLPSSTTAVWSPSLPAHWQALGQAGWNLAWIDLLQQNNQRPLQQDESPAFFSLLRLAGNRSAALAVGPSASGSAQPLPTIKETLKSAGLPVRWRVRLVQGSRVEVSADSQDLLGHSHYYQFDGFVDIGEERIQFKVGDEPVLFEREFPITLVSTAEEHFVPLDEIAAGNQSWQIGKFAIVDGRYFRLWSYQSDRIQKYRENARQAAPLVIASRLTPALPPAASARTSDIGWFGYALCLATLAILAAILVMASKKDRSRLVK